jgi:hypothetical protein
MGNLDDAPLWIFAVGCDANRREPIMGRSHPAPRCPSAVTSNVESVDCCYDKLCPIYPRFVRINI